MGCSGSKPSPGSSPSPAGEWTSQRKVVPAEAVVTDPVLSESKGEPTRAAPAVKEDSALLSVKADTEALEGKDDMEEGKEVGAVKRRRRGGLSLWAVHLMMEGAAGHLRSQVNLMLSLLSFNLTVASRHAW